MGERGSKSGERMYPFSKLCASAQWPKSPTCKAGLGSNLFLSREGPFLAIHDQTVKSR